MKILLKEIEQEGIDIGKIIVEKGLDGEYPYGQRVRACETDIMAQEDVK